MPLRSTVSGDMTPQWGRAFVVCTQGACANWIWTDKVRTGTKRRKCGAWWPETSSRDGKGKGYGRPTTKTMANQQRLEAPPGLTKIKPLKRAKVQQEGTELLSTSRTTLA